jgi:hypothetical protein
VLDRFDDIEQGYLDIKRPVLDAALERARELGVPVVSRNVPRFARPVAYREGDKDAPFTEQDIQELARQARGTPLIVLDPIGLRERGKGGIRALDTADGIKQFRADGKPWGRRRDLTPAEADAVIAELGCYYLVGRMWFWENGPVDAVADRHDISARMIHRWLRDPLDDLRGFTRRDGAKVLAVMSGLMACANGEYVAVKAGRVPFWAVSGLDACNPDDLPRAGWEAYQDLCDNMPSALAAVCTTV